MCQTVILIQIWHPIFSAKKLKKYFDINPKFEGSVNEPRISASGKQYEVYKKSYLCSGDVFPLQKIENFDEAIHSVNEYFESRIKDIEWLELFSKTGGKISYYISVYTNSASILELSLNTLKKCSELNVELGMEIWNWKNKKKKPKNYKKIRKYGYASVSIQLFHPIFSTSEIQKHIAVKDNIVSLMGDTSMLLKNKKTVCRSAIFYSDEIPLSENVYLEGELDKVDDYFQAGVKDPCFINEFLQSGGKICYYIILHISSYYAFSLSPELLQKFATSNICLNIEILK